MRTALGTGLEANAERCYRFAVEGALLGRVRTARLPILLKPPDIPTFRAPCVLVTRNFV